MERRIAVVFLIGTLWIGAESTIHLPTLPSLSSVVNTITNTTFRVMRGGINLASTTFEAILDSSGSIADKIRELFEEIRKYMAVGVAILGIPVLEPLRIDHIEVNITHEALSLAGTLDTVRVRQLSKFKLDYVHVDFNTTRRLYELYLNLTFPFIEVDGKYDISGVIGDLFSIFGDGPFWLKMQEFKIGTKTNLWISGTRLDLEGIHIESMDIDVKLKGMENNFKNLMNDENLEGIFNRAISSLAPEAVDILWSEVKHDVEQQVVIIINELLKEISFRNILGRLFNVLRVGR